MSTAIHIKVLIVVVALLSSIAGTLAYRNYHQAQLEAAQKQHEREFWDQVHKSGQQDPWGDSKAAVKTLQTYRPK